MDHTSTPAGGTERRRWWWVHISIVGAFLLFFVFVSLLYWNWLRVSEPTAIIHIPRGTDRRAGMMIEVEGWNLSKPLRLELTEENAYGGRIYVSPGVYNLKIFEDGELVRAYADVNVLEYREVTINVDGGPAPDTLNTP